MKNSVIILSVQNRMRAVLVNALHIRIKCPESHNIIIFYCTAACTTCVYVWCLCFFLRLFLLVFNMCTDKPYQHFAHIKRCVRFSSVHRDFAIPLRKISFYTMLAPFLFLLSHEKQTGKRCGKK